MTNYTTNDDLIQALFDELVPQSGGCDTLAGELIRAVNRIKYDYLNNGFGNNWSGALNFLDQELDLPRKAYATLKPYARGKIAKRATFDSKSDPVLLAIEKLENAAITEITGPRRTELRKINPDGYDLFNLQEKDKWS